MAHWRQVLAYSFELLEVTPPANSVFPAEHPLNDFRNFLYMVWKHLNLPDPTPVQYDIAYYLQHGNKRKVIEAFRGVGKSWITSAYVCWCLLINPQEKILVISASSSRSNDFSTFTKRLIYEIPILRHLIPKTDQRDSNISFDVAPSDASHAPSVKSVGITGQITGSRATKIIADDVESFNNSATQTQREKLAETVKEFDAILSPVPNAEIIYLGTPQTEESIYNLLEDRGYQVRIWTARFPKDWKHYESYGNRLAPFICEQLESKPEEFYSKPVDPKRFNDLELTEREASYGKSGFALQFMLDTTLSDADRYPLKLSDLIVMSCDKDKAPVKLVWGSRKEDTITDLPNLGFSGDRFHKPMWMSQEWADYQGCVMSIDPSGRGKDETGYAIVKCLAGMLYVVDAGGLKGGYDEEALVALANKAKEHKVNYVVIEDNFGDGMFTALFKPILTRIYPVTIDPDGVRSLIQKERRIIETLEPVMNQHRLVIDPIIFKRDGDREDKHRTLTYQMTRLTKERGAILHDDVIDALAIAVKYWLESLSRDSETSLEDHKGKLLDEALVDFMDNVFGTDRSKSNSWASL